MIRTEPEKSKKIMCALLERKKTSVDVFSYAASYHYRYEPRSKYPYKIYHQSVVIVFADEYEYYFNYPAFQKGGVGRKRMEAFVEISKFFSEKLAHKVEVFTDMKERWDIPQSYHYYSINDLLVKSKKTIFPLSYTYKERLPVQVHKYTTDTLEFVLLYRPETFQPEFVDWSSVQTSYLLLTQASQHFDSERFNWTKNSCLVAQYCPEHFDPEKYNWEDHSWTVAKYCPNFIDWERINRKQYIEWKKKQMTKI